jgi:hypothetical protein
VLTTWVFTTSIVFPSLNLVPYLVIIKEKKMEEIKELVDKVLKNRSLTIFLGIVVLALVMGWVGG